MQQTETGTTSDMQALDQRSGDRFGIGLPITWDDGAGEGETLDISDTGILFETSSASRPAVGARLVLMLESMMDGQQYHTRCEAEVVRVEQVGSRVNVATRLLSPLDAGQ